VFGEQADRFSSGGDVSLLTVRLSLFVAFVSAVSWAQSTATVMNPGAAARFLDQATWGATPADVGHLQQIGTAAWLKEQFAASPSPIPDVTATATNLDNVREQFFVNAVSGPDQLRQRVAFALSEIWVVSNVKLKPQAIPPYLRLLANDAFGNYSDLMHDVSLSPAMGHYLDMVNNSKPAPGQEADENYARELNQLFTIGTVMLNPDGTVVLSAGQPVPTYDASVVQEFALAFTGWTYAPLAGATPLKHNPENWNAPMVAVESEHDETAKTLLNGETLPAGQTAEQDLAGALKIVFNHPNVGPFVCQQLIQHLVTSNPSPAYVERIANVFDNNGAGVRGDMQSVISAILLDPEARAGDPPATPAANEGHLREPALYLAGILRALGAQVSSTNNLPQYTAAESQPLYAAPSVFNYFSPGYRVDGGKLLGPEFQIQSPSVAMLRADLVSALVYGSIGGVTFDQTPFVTLAASPDSLLDQLSTLLFHGQMPSDMRSTISTAMAAAPDTTLKARTALYLAASSSQYQVER
jgi:uncharacterized protein (DUF1800 family)